MRDGPEATKPAAVELVPGLRRRLVPTPGVRAGGRTALQGRLVIASALYPDGFFEIQLPVPPLSEQRQIVGGWRLGSGNWTGLQWRRPVR